MDDQVGINAAVRAVAGVVDAKNVVVAFNPLHVGAQLDIDAKAGERLHQPVHEVRVEAFQHPLTVLQNGDLRPGARGNVRNSAAM